VKLGVDSLLSKAVCGKLDLEAKLGSQYLGVQNLVEKLGRCGHMASYIYIYVCILYILCIV
jgi:hypothetical protein